jgi:signal transduction histidine kinase
VNLLSNAKYAVIAADRATRRITVRTKQVAADRVRIEVVDNGVGIPRENLTRIFSHGFTTRKDGHGFGLHSAANLARELGGSLTVQSTGVGKGATFVLELPFKTLGGQSGSRPSAPYETSTSGSSSPS